MKKTRYLIKKGNAYYFKRKIPKTNKNITISLQTDSLIMAKYIINVINFKIIKLFTLLERKQFKSLDREELHDYIKSLLKNYVLEAIVEYENLEELRHEDFTFTNEDGVSLDGGHPNSITKALDELEVAIFNKAKRDELYERIIKRTNITQDDINKIPADKINTLKTKLLKAEREVLLYDKKRNEDILEVPNLLKEEFKEFTQIDFQTPYEQKQSQFQEALKSKVSQAIIQNNNFYNKTLAELKEEYLAKKIKEGLKEPKRYDTDIQMLINITEKEYAVDISQDDMKEFANIVEHLPDKNKHGELYKTKTYREIFDLYEDEKWEKNSIGTVNDRISRISAFLTWCVEDEYLDRNRLANKKTKVQSKKKAKKWERVAFSDEDLEKLFKSSWYTDKLLLNLKNHPDKIFAPLLGLYQGFRVNELCSLYIKDIITIKDIVCINIEEDEDDKHIKGDSTERIVPLHPKLIELGFLDFVKYQKKQKYERVFQNLYYTNGKGYGQAFSKKFANKNFKAEFIDEKFYKSDAKKRKDFHSFRHTFTENLKDVEGVQDGALDYLNGHVSKSHSQGTYGRRDMPKLFKILSKLEYGFDLTEIENLIHRYLKE